MDFNKELLNRVEYIEEIINKQLSNQVLFYISHTDAS